MRHDKVSDLVGRNEGGCRGGRVSVMELFLQSTQLFVPQNEPGESAHLILETFEHDLN